MLWVNGKPEPYLGGHGAVHLLNGLYDAKLDHQGVVAIVGQQKRMLKLREHAPQAQLVLLNSQAEADAFVEALIRRMGGRT